MAWCKVVELPLAATIMGALSQVETMIELTNRVCFTVQADADFLGNSPSRWPLLSWSAMFR